MNENDLARGILARLQANPTDSATQQAIEAHTILQALHNELAGYVKTWRGHQIPTYKKCIARNEWDAPGYIKALAELEYLCGWFDRLETVQQDTALALYIELVTDDSYPGDSSPLHIHFRAALNQLWRKGKLPALTAGAHECERLNTEAAIEARANWKALHGGSEPQPLALESLELP